jgi:flagellar FliJ protein
MKRFHFPLRPVAILRAHQQARAREIFAAAVSEYGKAWDRLAALQARQRDLEARMQAGRRTIYRAADEVSALAAYHGTCTEVTKADQAVTAARAVMDERREQYLEAHRAVKVVDKLELKARTAYRQEVERESQIELDEMAGFRVARRLAASTIASS